MKDIINEVILRVNIYDGNNKDITTKLDILPTKLIAKGEKISASGTITYKKNIWRYEDKMLNIPHVDIILEKFIRVFENKEDSLHLLSKNHPIVISIVLYMKKGTPSITLSKKHLSFLHKIQAELDVDLYCS